MGGKEQPDRLIQHARAEATGDHAARGILRVRVIAQRFRRVQHAPGRLRADARIPAQHQ